MAVPPFDLRRQLETMGPALDQAVLEVLHSGQYIGGKVVARFESAFAGSVGTAHAVSCNSCTDALVLALRALEVGPGDEVITTAFSFFATAEAISAVGAQPVFVDVDPGSYLLDLDQAEAAIGPRTRALLPVHLFGRPLNMERCMAVAHRHGLKVVEDCAQAAGSRWASRPVGAWGDAGCFSFFPTKNLGAAGDGGCVTTNDPRLSQRMRELAVHGMAERYVHNTLGYNSRLDALQAAVLLVKLPHLPSLISARQRHAEAYGQALAHVNGLVLPSLPGMAGHSWNQFVVRIPGATAQVRDQVRAALQQQGINTIIYYPIPIHRQPAYRHLDYSAGSLPVTERLAGEVLSLPMFPELTVDQRGQVVDSLRLALGNVTAPLQGLSA
ncbi:DegT/DnrJ/EryC1/StrS family aminotransferase [Candidatus Synechococcus spongiarum]|uniref:Aminotransferase n=1 Tax=Candidatus Synechococcus spongiarum LMB bulk15N TaxID=1943583 RepID=A0A1T1D137_9SYNE|nr:DegT/DnrJ/EryC1/StrS family aminotransferase [Candidatus Synechococcus spongiarum]OOV34585.1 aminotransferase [Candidatus Synechococcus spongiarum LMB bulk15N]